MEMIHQKKGKKRSTYSNNHSTLSFYYSKF